MLEKNLKAVNRDVKVLVQDAQALFQAAAALTGDKAEELRARAMRLLDSALVAAQEAQTVAVGASKEMADSAEQYVKENPWQALAAAAGVGFLVGVIMTRK
ncbi:ElaB/YqjD/DUF883 family membrane-anchored ribosome-binding protein [Collimonas sp. PA-H2]|uniref:DUF883 family protein n=1 Tax=Collimonas sp. PA-H2 TaxID=1881062 RepID=UPI000BF268F3|nr:DUF883 family protein [Collimonas sp. PA-H2]PFH04534.1 ElaB/YqjD/DUF883 family membrane-anchored ribosome-binding protein [Collimonas sp. PA-H2]